MLFDKGDMVEFKLLTSDYESRIKSLRGILKSDYLGQVGEVVNFVYADVDAIYDVRFSDGQTWCFEKEQLTKIKKKNPKETKAKKKTIKVLCVETKKEYESVKEAAKEYKVTKEAIRIACRNNTMCKKKHWRYIE